MKGYLAPGFEKVGDAFDRNFREHGDLGAAFAAFRHGVAIVDIWDGVADKQSNRAWDEGSLQLIFSGTKGLVATCVLILLERKGLSLDAPVNRYWTAFGKPEIRIRDIVSHTARLPGVDEPVTLDDLVDDRLMSSHLAQQKPSTDPRASFSYHAFTYGWLCGELVRQVDGRSIGQFFADEVASPLGLELWIGLPSSEESRVTTLELSPTWGKKSYLDPSAHKKDALLRCIWGNPELFSPVSFPWNRADFHRAEIPGANAIGTARSIAKLYACLAAGGKPILTEATVRRGREMLSSGYDVFIDQALKFGVGFQLQTETKPYGPPLDAFGHSGAGGSTHGAWPSKGVGYSYAMNCMVDDVQPDARAPALLAALHAAVCAQDG